MGNGGNVEGEVLGGWSAGVGAGAVWTLVCGLEQAGRHASRIEMMQDGNKSRSKCGVMLALGGCCASDRLCAALRCAGDESSVGRSVDSLFWRAGVIRLFPPSPFPLTRPAQHPREKQVCLCQLAAPWPAHVGERVGWRYSYYRLEPLGIITAWAALLSRRTLRYVPRYILPLHAQYPTRGSGYLRRYLGT